MILKITTITMILNIFRLEIITLILKIYYMSINKIK